MIDDIEAEYKRRRAAFAAEFSSSTARGSNLILLLLLALIALVYTAFNGIHQPERAWWAVVPLAMIVAIIPLQLRARAAAQRASRLLALYQRGAARLDGSEPQSGHTGEAFRKTADSAAGSLSNGHLYDRDLNILGPESIFGMLATTRTAVGQRSLAQLLLHSADAEIVRERQAAVQELAPMLDLRETVALLGRSAFDELPAESFDRWLSPPPETDGAALAMWMRWVMLILTFAWLGLVLAALLHRVNLDTLPRNLAALLALQGAFALWMRPRVTAELKASHRLAGQTTILRDGLRVLREQAFKSPLLRQMQQRSEGDENALKSLSGSLNLVEQRSKEWFYAPGLLLAVGSQAAISLVVWKQQHTAAMYAWIETWAAFEAMLAVATYAVEHPANIYPEITGNGAASFLAEALAHPLLPRAQAVANDISLGQEERFLLVSGSNMAGKSTLLRAVGCNVVLALAGAPICARSASMSALRVGASLALVDSLAEGKSKFLAEVERLRDLVALAKQNPGNSLFLIDEIFSGTNSADRRAAAEAVLRRLMREGAIGALSTHDLALAELAELPELGGRNVHMASPDEADPLGFDYLLKPGVNRSTNALAIVKMLGLAD